MMKTRKKPGVYRIIAVRRSFMGRGGYGYNEVELENGKVINLRQKKNRSWRVGDTIPKSKARALKRA